MIATELFLVTAARTLVEVAGVFLLGQGVLWLLAGASRERNVIYQLFCVVTSPVTRTVRALTPRIVLDRHIPVVSFCLLFWLWISLAYVRVMICDGGGIACH